LYDPLFSAQLGATDLKTVTLSGTVSLNGDPDLSGCR